MNNLSAVLFPALNRSFLNPGNVYRVDLSRGLRVDFLTRQEEIRMQLSRTSPSTPSDTEIEVCLEALNVPNPNVFAPKKFFYQGRNFVQVSFAHPKKEAK